jgi:hypothetical protein
LTHGREKAGKRGRRGRGEDGEERKTVEERETRERGRREEYFPGLVCLAFSQVSRSSV